MARGHTPGGWYLVGIGLLGTALAISITGYMQMRDSVRGLQRVVIPGKAELTLTQGRSTIYAEHRSTVAGVDYTLDTLPSFTCKVTGVESTLELKPPRAKVSYSFGDFAGRNAFDLDVPAPGTYTLECTAPQQLVLAVGGGIGAWIVVALVGGLLPGLAGLALIAVVFFKRRRK